MKPIFGQKRSVGGSRHSDQFVHQPSFLSLTRGGDLQSIIQEGGETSLTKPQGALGQEYQKVEEGNQTRIRRSISRGGVFGSPKFCKLG